MVIVPPLLDIDAKIDSECPLTLTLSPGGARELFFFDALMSRESKSPPLPSAGEGWGEGEINLLIIDSGFCGQAAERLSYR
jgi:hypothetical protein